MSSLAFAGNSSSYLKIPNASAFNFGTGDFTIEWYQYQTDTNSFPRIFQVGSYPSTVSIGVSIEGGSFIYWTNTAHVARTLASSSYKNVWVHFAICRVSGVTSIYMNGTSIFSMNDTTNFSSASDLTIGNESTVSNTAAFGGYITYFSWVKGVALYTSNFTVSNQYPTLTSNYVLLLKATSFDGTLGNTVANTNVSTTPNVPLNFLASNNNNNNQSVQVIPKSIKSLFTNNALVYYSPGSLAACGVGSVRNSSAKRRKI